MILQNSKRTSFYRKFILKDAEWSSSETTLEPGQTKKDFDEYPVLDRMELQLKNSKIPTNYIKNVKLNWALEDLSKLTEKYTNRNYIMIFPFLFKKT